MVDPIPKPEDKKAAEAAKTKADAAKKAAPKGSIAVALPAKKEEVKPFDPLKNILDELKAENLGIKDLERSVKFKTANSEEVEVIVTKGLTN